MFLLYDTEKKAVYCNDKLWRSFFNFGTFNICIKLYKRFNNAVRVQDKANYFPAIEKQGNILSGAIVVYSVECFQREKEQGII